MFSLARVRCVRCCRSFSVGNKKLPTAPVAPTTTTRAPKRAPSFFSNPVAGSINLIADVVDMGRSAAVSTVRGTASAVAGTADTITDKAVDFVPAIADLKVPGVVHATVGLAEVTAHTAKAVVQTGVNAADFAGSAVGSSVGRLVFDADADADAKETEKEEKQKDDEDDGFVAETGSAVKRLFGVGASTVRESIEAVDFASTTLLASAKRNSKAVVSKSLGKESADVLERAIGVAQTSLDTAKTAHTFGSGTVVKIAQKSAVKAVLAEATKTKKTKSDE